mmetsp:Transcript_29475/g.32794  ORF Transcript_29475/g.32794 Transcript_29475/m.32794 type:complete len:244 (-) Transcript_29475:328-1059(-)
MAGTRAMLLQEAHLAQQTSRIPDMANAMIALGNMGNGFDTDERDLFSRACRKRVGQCQASLRAITTLLERERDNNESSVKLDLIEKYKDKLYAELHTLCTQVLDVLANRVIPVTKNIEDLVLYHKMQGDYWRYLAEFGNKSKCREYANRAHAGYEKGLNIAASKLQPTNWVRLGLLNNFSVLYYDVLDDTQEAVLHAKTAFDEAIRNIAEANFEEEPFDLTMQLLRENIALWEREQPEGERRR